MTELADCYTHCPKCGSENYQRLPQHHRCCANCGHHDFNNPITGVGAMIQAADGEILWIRRGREPGKGKLGTPGGFVDPGESLEQAAIREVREETGLEIFALRYLCSYANPYMYDGCVRPVCDAFFTAQANSKVVTAKPGEISECLWRKAEEIDPEELAFDSMRVALRTFLNRAPTY